MRVSEKALFIPKIWVFKMQKALLVLFACCRNYFVEPTDFVFHFEPRKIDYFILPVFYISGIENILKSAPHKSNTTRDQFLVLKQDHSKNFTREPTTTSL